MMQSALVVSLVAGLLLILRFLLSCWFWHRGKTRPAATKPPRTKRAPKPFAGLTHQPACERCAQGVTSPLQRPAAPPPPMQFTRGRRRHVDTTGHFCSHPHCSYRGGVDWGNVRANGHPNGRRWRQFVCLGCQGSVLETVGTPLHGQQVEAEKRVWAIAAWAAGRGSRAVARVFEVDPNTVLGWRVEAAEYLEACSRYCLREVDIEQVQMDELFALLSAVTDGAGSARQAMKR